MLLPNRMEIMGTPDNSISGPGALTKAVLKHPHGIDFLEVETVDQPVAPTAVVYNQGSNLEHALEYCEETETPLILLSDESIPADPSFPLIRATRGTLASVRYTTREIHAECVFDIYAHLPTIPNGSHSIADLVNGGIVSFARSRPSLGEVPANVRLRGPRALSIKTPPAI